MIHFSKVIEQKTNRYKMSDKNSRHESMKEEGESVKALLDALLPLCIKTLKPNVADPGCSIHRRDGSVCVLFVKHSMVVKTNN